MRRRSQSVEVTFRWAKAHPTFMGLVVLAAALVACGDEPSRLLQQGNPDATVEAWRELFDEVPVDHPMLARAKAVFERVRVSSGTHADLVVLDIPGAPLALALDDQAVVLSSGGLELCYRGVAPDAGDARLAFVLGHELGHVASDDFWHASAFATVRDVDDPTEQAERLQELLRQDARDRQVMELKADDQGMLALIQADYDPRPLLEGGRTFFEEWVSGLVGSTAYDDPNHPRVGERAGFLQKRLREVAATEKVFQRGVEAFRKAEELASTAEGDEVPPEVWAGYEEAVKAFDAVRRVFPGREVLSNLALAHLRLATIRLAGCDGSLVNRYYLPTAIDPVTLASRARLRGERDYSSPCFENEGYQRQMRAAIRLLEEAVERDPLYLPARLNLTAAYVLDEMAANAVVQGLAAAEIDGDDPRAAAAPWVAHVAYHDRGGAVDLEQVLQALAEHHRRFPDDPGIAFNLASALSYQGRFEEAVPVWEDFLRVEPDGAWAEIAREWVGEQPGDLVAAGR